jgi:hypothetical protein
MSEQKETNGAIETENGMRGQQERKPSAAGLSRRTFLEVGSAGLASAALASLTAAQERADTEKADQDHSSSNPGPENKPLLDENPNSNLPPPTDHGHIEPIWYSFDLTTKRVEEGGWTNQVTERVLPNSKDLAGGYRLWCGLERRKDEPGFVRHFDDSRDFRIERCEHPQQRGILPAVAARLHRLVGWDSALQPEL